MGVAADYVYGEELAAPAKNACASAHRKGTGGAGPLSAFGARPRDLGVARRAAEWPGHAPGRKLDRPGMGWTGDRRDVDTDGYRARLRAALPDVRERIQRARERGGGEEVTLVAVTKGHPLDAAYAVAAEGIGRCGENRVQELADKVEAARGSAHADSIEWHLIGHLQRNKVRRALPLFSLIHSVDSLRLARSLSEEASRIGERVEGLVQLNVSGEETKGGIREGHVDAVGRICELEGLRVTGLMTMAPLTDDEHRVRRTFRRAREVFEECARAVSGFQARHLSMGMSQDYEVAVEEGSTMVRLGTVLLGERGR